MIDKVWAMLGRNERDAVATLLEALDLQPSDWPCVPGLAGLLESVAIMRRAKHVGVDAAARELGLGVAAHRERRRRWHVEARRRDTTKRVA